MIYGGGGDGEHGDSRENGEDRDHEKNGALGKGVADRARRQGDGDVAGMVEGGIAPQAPRQLFPGVETKGQGRDRWTENVAGDRDQAVGCHHRPETRRGEYRRGAYRQNGKRQNDEFSLGARCVDRGADWRLERKTEQAADCRHQADLRLAPMLIRDQEDVEVRPERPSDVGEQKIERVEGGGPKAGFGRPNVWRVEILREFTHVVLRRVSTKNCAVKATRRQTGSTGSSRARRS